MSQLQTQPDADLLTPSAHQLLAIQSLAVSFANRDGVRTQALAGVSLSVFKGQTLAIVGESGSGKSVTALAIMGLIQCPPGRIDGGSIHFDGRNLLSLPRKSLLAMRGGKIAMIFQEPMTSLNPVFTVGEQIIEAILLHQPANRKRAKELAIQAMSEVGIDLPATRLGSYPHQFSGGMRQRVMIAMALACRPELLLADEPTTALDVTIQAQILSLLRGIQNQHGLGMVLITHDLGIVAQNADVVCVMYAGRVVEYARVLDLFDKPLHPYTRGLLQCKPKLHEKKSRLTVVGQTLDDPAAFKPFDAHEGSPKPWWPSSGAASEKYCLLEIEPEHWVGCHALNGSSTVVERPPMISFRRDFG